jgi:hypothetical protein
MALVKDSECIVKIEVGLKSQSNLGGLDFTFESNKVTKAINQLVFLV